jgi:hypothetical protein
LNRQFSEEAKMTNEYMNKCSTSLALKEMKIKTKLRFYLSLWLEWQSSTKQMLARMQGKWDSHILLVGM